ncbi:DUF5348 domain-containing protein [Clostridium tagluense]|uniref:DUF5348 domain-containing protein n=1 Tax=Clostridium tagluense TaxID=360422 RepID=UPI001CF2DDE5|nr:DUF5348 domain-containing protein [Clostridium tagluense]MCB2298701.1 DUF5348 domain-containing protein [Clostridium tagluense]
MDKEYIKAISTIIEKTKHDIQNYYEVDLCEKPKYNEVNKSLEKLLKQLEDTKSTINNYLKITNEGYLVLEHVSSNYVIKFLDGSNFQPLVCGFYLEAYINNKGWSVVKVEYDLKKGYYFYNPEIGCQNLYPNMKVRVR